MGAASEEMEALSATILGTWRHSTLPLALHSPRGSPRSVQGNTMLPGRRRWQPRACLAAGATNWGLPRLRVPKTRTGNRHVGVPAQRLCSRPGDAGPGELPRLLVPPQLPLPTFSGTRPAGGFGILTISEPVLCQELPLANLLLLHSQALEVHVCDRSWAFHLPGQRHFVLEIQFVGEIVQKHQKMKLWKQLLLQPKALVASLSVALDLTDLDDVQKAIGFIADIIVGGNILPCQTCDQLVCARFGVCQDTILSNEQRPMLSNMLESENYTRLRKECKTLERVMPALACDQP